MAKIRYNKEDEENNSCNLCYGNYLGMWNGEEYEPCSNCEERDSNYLEGFDDIQGGFMDDLDKE